MIRIQEKLNQEKVNREQREERVASLTAFVVEASANIEDIKQQIIDLMVKNEQDQLRIEVNPDELQFWSKSGSSYVSPYYTVKIVDGILDLATSKIDPSTRILSIFEVVVDKEDLEKCSEYELLKHLLDEEEPPTSPALKALIIDKVAKRELDKALKKLEVIIPIGSTISFEAGSVRPQPHMAGEAIFSFGRTNDKHLNGIHFKYPEGMSLMGQAGLALFALGEADGAEERLRKMVEEELQIELGK
jgi:hypothetical protein